MGYYQRNNYYDDSSSSSDDIDYITSGISNFSLNQNRGSGYNNNNSYNRPRKIFYHVVERRNRMMRTNLASSPVTYTQMSEGSWEWNSISENIGPSLCLRDLHKVNNPFLKMAFDLKRTFFYDNIKPKQLFHGTKQDHVEDICTHNFDWRLAGMERGHRYGKGVNFTANARFATNFCDPGRNNYKVLILADVLVRHAGVGRENLRVPPKGCDTTMRENDFQTSIYVQNHTMGYYQRNNYYDDSSSSSDDIDYITSGISNFSLNQNRGSGYNNNNSYNRPRKIFYHVVERRNRMMRTNLASSPVTYTQMSEGSWEWNSISENIGPSLCLRDLHKVNNPFLKMAFDLKRTFFYDNIKPKQLFHGTKQDHVEDICTHNFDWRLAGMERGHRYGKGVNFTANARFATNFCDPGRNNYKVLILADVLVRHAGVGRENLRVPPKGCDTTMRENGSTFVKFYDAEFCPTYVLHVKRYH